MSSLMYSHRIKKFDSSPSLKGRNVHCICNLCCNFCQCKYLPALSKLGFHFAMKGLPCCWSKQYFEWSQEAEASLKKVKEEEGHKERLKPELILVKSEFRCWRWLLLLLRKAESPDPCGKLCRGFNSEMLASCRQLRFFWRETSRHSPVNKLVSEWHSNF